jgi:hypothetical protein
VRECALSLDKIRAAIGTLPDASQQKVASANVVMVELVVASGNKPE